MMLNDRELMTICLLNSHPYLTLTPTLTLTLTLTLGVTLTLVLATPHPWASLITLR